MTTAKEDGPATGTVSKGLAEGKVGTLSGAMLGISCVAPGYTLTASIGTALAAVVGACDGELELGAICSAVAHLLEVSESELLAEVLPSVRELVTTGFLTF